ncbi:LAMI_0H11716g1_1 [Lachancea mirantina]|uniref:LAMI_0H11716g1_1 n=1 Tax=Lachancea mirantina TaxID=1230905 RepID=A0A1G4KHB4_9SACH|nr:LAMI_0H11716g1_1 [Lachancea mirantina]
MESSALVKQLASNSRVVREEAFESLRKYLATRQFKEGKQLQFDKLWKGLYFSMWFSDRPRPQQRLADSLAELHLLYFSPADNRAGHKAALTGNDAAFIKFSKAFWRIICLEWYGIDHHRLDKYLLLVRRVLNAQLRYLQSREWQPELVTTYIFAVLRKLPLSGSKKVYNGIPFHIIDILLDEWEKLVFNEDDLYEGEDNDDEQNSVRKQELIAATPLNEFLDIFQDLSSNTNNIKVLRDKIKEDIFGDARLKEWGVGPSALRECGEDDNDDEDEDDEDEWNGF